MGWPGSNWTILPLPLGFLASTDHGLARRLVGERYRVPNAVTVQPPSAKVIGPLLLLDLPEAYDEGMAPLRVSPGSRPLASPSGRGPSSPVCHFCGGDH
jgi:hypothetical protein